MSNAGCDMFTALGMILNEDLDLGDDNVFVIEMSRKPLGLPGGCKALFYAVKKY